MKEPSLRKTIVEEVLGFVGVSVAEVRPVVTLHSYQARKAVRRCHDLGQKIPGLGVLR